MTDRHPDDLYDALRDRLADYGQEPPAPLWANIRAQLSPPVAVPQLRRRHRWAPAALLVLLLAVMSGAGWLWRHAPQRPSLGQATQKAGSVPPSTTTTGPTIVSRAGTLAAATANSAAQPRGLVEARGPVSPPMSGPAATALARGTNTVISAAPAAGASPATNAGSPGPKPPHPASNLQPDVAAATGVARQLPGAAGTRGRTTRAASAAIAPDGPDGPWATRHPAALANQQHGNEPVATAAKRNPTEAESMAAIAAGPNLNSGTKRRNKGLQTPTASVAHDSEANALLTLQPLTSYSTQAHPAADGTPTMVGAGSPSTNEILTRPATEAGVLARPATLQLRSWPAPAAPQPVAVEPSPRSKPLGGRWAVQALVGPALTYRYLSAAPTAASPSPIARPTSPYSALAATTPVAELERPALGAGAQLGLRRTLGPHWTLSAGMGYTEYATRLALQQVPAAADTAILFIPPTRTATVPTSIHRRDTYRFVTVPLRLAYTWTLTGRWRVGALAGADAAFYVGGSSTEGSACACQAQAWGATGSPYRRFSLGASLGAEVRYRLTDRWELLAQPTASYLLSPLATAGTGYYRRHLLGGTALLGASFDLP